MYDVSLVHLECFFLFYVLCGVYIYIYKLSEIQFGARENWYFVCMVVSNFPFTAKAYRTCSASSSFAVLCCEEHRTNLTVMI